jgi:hypothetical protein
MNDNQLNGPMYDLGRPLLNVKLWSTQKWEHGLWILVQTNYGLHRNRLVGTNGNKSLAYLWPKMMCSEANCQEGYILCQNIHQ